MVHRGSSSLLVFPVRVIRGIQAPASSGAIQGMQVQGHYRIHVNIYVLSIKKTLGNITGRLCCELKLFDMGLIYCCCVHLADALISPKLPSADSIATGIAENPVWGPRAGIIWYVSALKRLTS